MRGPRPGARPISGPSRPGLQRAHRARVRAAWLSLLVLLVAASSVRVEAQGSRAPARIGVLSPSSGSESAFFEVLRTRLQELGWVDGRNVSYTLRAAEHFEELAGYAAELVRLRVDVIVTAGPQGVRAARGATETIPIVMGNVGDAVDQGFVTSLAKPGGNLTGLSTLNTELSAKRLQLLKQALPAVSRVALLREALGDANPARAAESAASALGVRLEIYQVRGADELSSAFSGIATARVGALEVLPSSLFASQLRRIVELAALHRIPAIYPDSRFVRAGGLMSYGPDVPELYRRAAVYVDRILRGARAGDLPVEQPTTFELAVNVRTARALGLSIPDAVRARADLVVD